MENLALNGRDVFIQMAGFLLLFLLLSKFMYEPLTRVIAERERRIKEKMDEAERNSLDMQNMRDEYQRRIGAIELETRDKIQAFMKEAMVSKDEMLEHARQESERLLDRGREELTREKQKALVEMRDKIADLAMDAAEKLIEKTIDEKAHRALIDGIIQHGVNPS